MTPDRNVILGLRRVDWSDPARQNEYLKCVLSAMEHLGTACDYDSLACLSGCAFRGCAPIGEPNPGAYHVVHELAIVAHTFRMLGYEAAVHARSDFAADRGLIVESIDRGVPALTLEGVVNCSECCLIAGYDAGGAVLLDYNPFMDVTNDHDEPHDETGYFRKSGWHDGFFAQGGRIVTIGPARAPMSESETLREALRTAALLIRGGASESPEVRTGWAGHTRYAEAVCEEPRDPFALNLMMACLNCNLYQDKLRVPPFLRQAKAALPEQAEALEECARLYDRIAELRREMSELVPDDVWMTEALLPITARRAYARCVLELRDLEAEAATRFEGM